MVRSAMTSTATNPTPPEARHCAGFVVSGPAPAKPAGKAVDERITEQARKLITAAEAPSAAELQRITAALDPRVSRRTRPAVAAALRHYDAADLDGVPEQERRELLASAVELTLTGLRGSLFNAEREAMGLPLP